MDRETFEALREKRETSRTVITWSVYGICLFCGFLTLGYLLLGENKPKPVIKEAKFSRIQAAAPTPVKKNEL